METRQDIPIAEQTVQLERFPGKGGWTYARITEIRHEKKGHFGWKKVRGFIDDYEVKETHLMPMGKGMLFVPVKADIRKKIGKQEGDLVRIVLFLAEDLAPVTDDDFMICLEDDPDAQRIFNSFPEAEQKRFIDWISSVQGEDQKVERMAMAMSRILEGKFLWKV